VKPIKARDFNRANSGSFSETVGVNVARFFANGKCTTWNLDRACRNLLHRADKNPIFLDRSATRSIEPETVNGELSSASSGQRTQSAGINANSQISGAETRKRTHAIFITAHESARKLIARARELSGKVTLKTSRERFTPSVRRNRIRFHSSRLDKLAWRPSKPRICVRARKKDKAEGRAERITRSLQTKTAGKDGDRFA